ncbi:MAG: hypothetical protein LBT80_07600 [Lactobacillaceae bacterium]|jgi:hypothetical protein|nr:hypothetical protein [Lactobacillaceae bacterium]
MKRTLYVIFSALVCTTLYLGGTGSASTIKTSNDITELEKTRTMLAAYPDTKMLYLTKGGSIQSSAIVKESDPNDASKLITKDLSKDSKYTEMTAGQVKLLYANKELKVIKQVVDKQMKTNAKLAGTDKKTTAKASSAKTVKKGFSFGQLWHKLFN